MNRQFSVWRGPGEWVEAFTRLIFRTRSRRFLGDELQLERAVILFQTSLTKPSYFLDSSKARIIDAEGLTDGLPNQGRRSL